MSREAITPWSPRRSARSSSSPTGRPPASSGARACPRAALRADPGVTDQLRPRFPRLATLMEDAEHDVLAYLTFPAPHRTKLHSTNPLERLIKEIKRRTDVVGIFPGDASIVRLVGAVLLEQNDEWQLQHRYPSLETIAEIPAGEEPLEITQLPPKAA